MTTSTTTTADKILLDVVEPGLAQAFNDEVMVLDLATRKKKDYKGRKILFDVKLSPGGGVGARSEAISGVAPGLPAPGAPVHVNGTVYHKRIYGVLELTHDFIETSKGDKAAFAEGLADELTSKLTRMQKHANFMLLGDGRDILCTVATDGGGTFKKESGETLQVTVDTTRYLQPNDRVALWTSNSESSTVVADGGQSDTLGTLDSESVYVSSVDSDTTFTLKRDRLTTGDCTVANANVVRMFYETEYNSGTLIHNGMAGLRLIADDGTLATSFEGLSRTTYPQWKGGVVAASSLTEGTTLSKNHFLKLAHRVHRRGGDDIDTFIMDPTLMREFLVITDNDIRYAPVTEKDPGYKEGSLHITIGKRQVELLMDWDCPYGVLHGFKRSDLEYWELTPLSLDNNGGAVLKQAKPYTDTGAGDIYYAFMRMKGNIATKKPWNFGCITGLSYSAETA
jgi:hypothetical protein